MYYLHRCQIRFQTGKSLSSSRKNNQTPYLNKPIPSTCPCHCSHCSASLRPHGFNNIYDPSCQTKTSLPHVLVSYPLQSHDRQSIQTSQGNARTLFPTLLVGQTIQTAHGSFLLPSATHNKNCDRRKHHQMGCTLQPTKNSRQVVTQMLYINKVELLVIFKALQAFKATGSEGSDWLRWRTPRRYPMVAGKPWETSEGGD